MLTRESTLIQQSLQNKAYKDKFRLILTLPKCIKDLAVNSIRSNQFINLEQLQFAIFSAPAPAINCPNIEIKIKGQTYQVTSQTRSAYSPMRVNFTIDNLYGNYYVIWKWLEYINDPKFSGMNDYFRVNDVKKRFDKYLDYQSIITVHGLDEYEKPVCKWTYTNAFPIYLGEISYNFRLPEEAECSFDFIYSQLFFELVDQNLTKI